MAVALGLSATGASVAGATYTHVIQYTGPGAYATIIYRSNQGCASEQKFLKAGKDGIYSFTSKCPAQALVITTDAQRDNPLFLITLKTQGPTPQRAPSFDEGEGVVQTSNVVVWRLDQKGLAATRGATTAQGKPFFRAYTPEYQARVEEFLTAFHQQQAGFALMAQQQQGTPQETYLKSLQTTRVQAMSRY